MTVPTPAICGETFTDVSGHDWTCRSAPHGPSETGAANHYFVRDVEPDSHHQQLTKLKIVNRLTEPTFVNIEFDGVPQARGYLSPMAEEAVSLSSALHPTYHIGDDTFKIEPTSCRCGGSYAWLKLRPSGAWEMVGCICHHLPSGDPFERAARAVMDIDLPDSFLDDRADARDMAAAAVRALRLP